MKPVFVLVAVLGALAAFVPATAGAAVPCRDRIYNDWYHDGKIATSYPVACYRDALKKVPTDAREYSSLADDIRSALQGALALKNGHTKVPAQIGTGGAASSPRTELSSSKSSSKNNTPHDPVREQVSDDSNQTLPTSTVAAGATSDGGSGVPIPLLVLGGLALLLIAVGTVGAIAKRR